jgi:hypothetical protein
MLGIVVIVFGIQQVESSREGPHRKENVLLIQTQYKSFSVSHSPTSISYHFALRQLPVRLDK